MYGKPDVSFGYRKCATLIEKDSVLEVKEGLVLDEEINKNLAPFNPE